MPALIERCRTTIGEFAGPASALRSEYISMVEAYLAAVEVDLNSADRTCFSPVQNF